MAQVVFTRRSYVVNNMDYYHIFRVGDSLSTSTLYGESYVTLDPTRGFKVPARTIIGVIESPSAGEITELEKSDHYADLV